MKIIFTLSVFALVLFSCNNRKPVTVSTEKEAPAKQNFFPVTSYLKGEIYNLKKSGINPLHYTTVDNRTDSVWLKIEDLDTVFYEFLQPEIDSANLISLFTEKSFLDQSINAVTFTYDPTASLPDNTQLKHWDVYIDPKNNRVKRVFIIKQISKNKILQLTWVSGQWCKMLHIVTDENGISKIEKEDKITWDF